MKTLRLCILSLLMTALIAGCAGNDEHYVDLETGKHITVIKDSTNGYMVNAETNEPVAIYVDTRSNDTIYGKTGKVINNHVIKSDDGKYKYVSNDGGVKADAEEDGAYKIKDGDYKKKVEADGDIKIKDGDTKIKIDGKTGEKKVKED
ncbi:MAG: hypothetical protein ABIR19_03830 [Ginsengibacter sp.]